jgi:hypothetical protein
MHFIAQLGRSRTALAAENLFLRKQLAFYQERKIRSRRFDNATRFMLVLLSRGFACQNALINVTPKTFVGWHRQGFRLFWRWKSRLGRPPIKSSNNQQMILLTEKKMTVIITESTGDPLTHKARKRFDQDSFRVYIFYFFQ